MSSWLPKEILDHLEHAGYVAVPKERVREFYYTQDSSTMDMMQRCYDEKDRRQIERAVEHHLAHGIGLSLLKNGFLKIELDHLSADKNGGFEGYRHRASVWVVAPRTMK